MRCKPLIPYVSSELSFAPSFTIIISFVIGIIFTLPFAFIHKSTVKNKEKKLSKTKELKIKESAASEKENNEVDSIKTPADELSNSTD